MSDVEKVRRGSALLIGGIAAVLIGVLLTPNTNSDLSQVTTALTYGGAVAVAVGLVWLLTGLWRGDKTKV